MRSERRRMPKSSARIWFLTKNSCVRCWKYVGLNMYSNGLLNPIWRGKPVYVLKGDLPLVRPPSGLPLSYRRRSHIAESHIIPIQRKAPLPRSLAGFRQEPNSHRGGTGAAWITPRGVSNISCCWIRLKYWKIINISIVGFEEALQKNISIYSLPRWTPSSIHSEMATPLCCCVKGFFHRTLSMEHCELWTLAANALNGNAVAGQASSLLYTWTAALYDGADESSIVRWRRHLREHFSEKSVSQALCKSGYPLTPRRGLQSRPLGWVSVPYHNRFT